MRFLSDILGSSKPYKTLLSAVEKGSLPIAATGLSTVHKTVICAAITKAVGIKSIIITADEAQATEILGDIVSLGLRPLLFPVRDFCFGDTVSRSAEYEHRRINTLSALLDGDFDLLVCPVEAAIQYTVPPYVLRKNTFILSSGQQISMEMLTEQLLLAGYVRTLQVEGPGQFSVRGGIVDIYAAGESAPARIEFWGDEIDSLNYFDISTQRRTDWCESLSVTQAREITADSQELSRRLSDYMLTEKNLTAKRIKILTRDIETISSGGEVPFDRYLPQIYPCATVFDYVKDSQIFVFNSSEITAKLKAISERQHEDYLFFSEHGFMSPGFDKFGMDEHEFEDKTCKAVYLENFARSSYETSLKELVVFNLKRLPYWRGDVSVLLEDARHILEQSGRCVILAGEQKAAQVLYEQLCSMSPRVYLDTESDRKLLPGITVMTGGLSAGFEMPDEKFVLFTHNYLYSDSKKRKGIRRKTSGTAVGSLDELKQGEYVVHAMHGIGIFEGIQKITGHGITKDYIKIKYAKSDVLYVPVTQLDLISKYIGAMEDGSVKLNRLGNSEWQKTRARVKRAAKNMAKELTALYAKRMSVKGYAFSPDSELQHDFEKRFPYAETEDQIRCAEEIKRDMQRPVPMDRLLCGDVGFGKTEVALRAAFLCISEGKQCAILVPTTILAWQHFNTALSRFADMPVNIKMLSRFVSPREQKKVISDLASGKTDMVIGTHRLISDDIKFKDLGLVIVDEEQRFGVAQKEKLKELYPTVDVLTLSATPIPRTLNMAMSGLRDMSSIEEAPGDRLPVQTYVIEYNEGAVYDAIRKELRRSGQVYYLHNRTESIISRAAKIQQALPEARVAVAHGKMSEEELSKIWRDLVEHEIDILVCTTIIETGVDVPNANTLIVEDACRLGLSQLHQLRGRVGRSARRAYAYFCFKSGSQMTEIAEKRLEAIREFTEFGAGFKIAMRDLQIRGAGSILGGEQHGNMEAVGYDMYIRILNEAINEEKGIDSEIESECTVDLSISAYIPESYIPSLPARLAIYRRIASVNSESSRRDVIDELIDRFGDPPDSVIGLIDIAALRNRAAAMGIYEICEEGCDLKLKARKVTQSQIEKLTSAFGRRMCLSANDEPYYTIRALKGQKKQMLVAEIVNSL